ncbi:MAG: VCBS repeat-containing protein, partial [Bacteroidota bacterium]
VDRDFEDTASTFADIDGDGDLDLIVGSGGNIPDQRALHKNRIYINDGSGKFSKVDNTIPSLENNVSVIAPHDFDGDGDQDLFIGSRSVPGIYGVDPIHLFLENDGDGNFTDVTESKAFYLKDVGMVTHALWADYDSDSKSDLIITTDWGTPKIFKNNGRRLSPRKTSLDSMSGWWNTIYAEDINADGKMDFILGNQGENFSYRASSKSPIKMFVNDFDDNGTIEQLFTQNYQGKDVPLTLKRELTAQLNSLKKENLKFADYATKSIGELMDTTILNQSIRKEINTTKSIVALNKGNGQFDIIALPKEVQFSCVCDINCKDIDGDGSLDLILGGNNYDFKPQYSRLDASYGGVLIGSGDGNFRWTPYDESGFYVRGEIKHLSPFSDKTGREFLFVGINNQRPKVFSYLGN